MFDDIYIVSSKLKTARKADVSATERTLKLEFPAGYSEFVCRLGEGTLNNLIRINMPDRVPKQIRQWQAAWASAFFWEKGRRTLSKDKVLESIPIGDTLTGDQLIFHPAMPATLFILPRQSETIFRAGESLEAAIDWVCTSGKVARRQRFKYFESHKGRSSKRLAARTRDIDLGELCVQLFRLNVHDFFADEPSEIPGPGEEATDPYFEFFVRDFSGSLCLTQEGGKYLAQINYIGSLTQPKLRPLVRCLEEFGFVEG